MAIIRTYHLRIIPIKWAGNLAGLSSLLEWAKAGNRKAPIVVTPLVLQLFCVFFFCYSGSYSLDCWCFSSNLHFRGLLGLLANDTSCANGAIDLDSRGERFLFPEWECPIGFLVNNSLVSAECARQNWALARLYFPTRARKISCNADRRECTQASGITRHSPIDALRVARRWSFFF